MDNTKKKCFKCEIEWPLIYFYKHPKMKDGHLNKCKKCTRNDSLKHRNKNIDKIRAYDIRRAKTPERIKKSTLYAKKYRQEHPEIYKAQTAVGNAIRDKRLFKEPCCICGNLKVHAHHEDYKQPLKVIWVCALHHREIDLR
jgi:hypothetical protein